MAMSCEHVQELISPLIDHKVGAELRANLLAHIDGCRACTAHLQSMQNMRTVLRQMPQPAMPANLAAKLRVTASHERARQLAHSSLSARIESWSVRAQLFFDNLMRPVAVPFAGGLSSALVLFSLLVPSLSFPHHFADQALFTYPDGEIVAVGPAGAYQLPMVMDSPRIVRVDTAVPDDANVVELTVDENGRVSDWNMQHGYLTADLQNIIMFSQFRPATFLGLPTSGKVKAVQQRPPQRVRGLRS